MAEYTTLQVEFEVPDISCSGCVRGVTKALDALEGVEVVNGDADTKNVRVHYRPDKVGVDQIRSAMEEAGFSPE